MHGGSDNSAPPFSSSADPQRSFPLDVSGGGRWEGLLYDPPYADLQISSDLFSSLSVDSSASNISQCQSPAIPAYPADYSPSQEVVTTVAVPHTLYQQSMAMAHTSIFRTISSSGGTAQPPYARIPTSSASSLVSYNAPLKKAPIKKKRKRLNEHQFRTLSTVLSHTRYPSTEKREELARYLGIQTRSVQVWWVFLYLHRV